MYRGFIATLFLLLVFALSAAQRPESSKHTEDVQGLRVLNVQSVKQPEKGSMSSVCTHRATAVIPTARRIAVAKIARIGLRSFPNLV